MAQLQSWGNYRLPKGLIADLPNTLENTRLGPWVGDRKSSRMLLVSRILHLLANESARASQILWKVERLLS